MPRNRNPYAKSCVRVYNNSVQPVFENPATLTLEGTPVVESGCSLTLNPSSIVINNSGLYHLSADVTFTAVSKGNSVIQLYMDGLPLPCAVAKDFTESGNTFTTHVETEVCVQTCCMKHPAITLVTSGVDGEVSHTCVGVLKLA